MAVVAFEMSDRHYDANLPFRRLRIGFRQSRNIDGALAEDVRRLACAGVAAIEVPKRIAEGKCFYDYFKACW